MAYFRAIAATSAIFLCGYLAADEGMWTFDNPPRTQLAEKYHFTPTQQWLDHIRLSSVRLNDGGSGSFVSPRGLLLTNHHVARGQLQKNSTADHDYIKNGFYAATEDQEMKTPDLEVNVLISTENVTSRIQSSVSKAKSAEDQFAARRAAIADIERESEKATGLRSDIVTLYQGGEYWLYRYKKYTDVRIVFAPEQQIAFFGGDPDNFTYPRYDLDMALFRVYENGKPIDSKDYLKWNAKGAADEDLVFVSGNPGSTQRLDTLAQLAYQRNMQPEYITLLKSRIETMEKYSAQGPEQARQASTQIFGLQNSLKAYEGMYSGLQDARIMNAKQKAEDEFKARVNANAAWKQEYGSAWDEIAEAMRKASTRSKEQLFHGTNSTLASLAATIVDYVAEVKKPDGERLPGFHEAQLESLRYTMFSPAPVYPAMEIARMIGALELDLKEVGADDPFLKIVLDGKSPHDAAVRWITGSKMADPAFRKSLVEGGESAVAASTDPLIVLERNLDPLRREMIKWEQDNVESVEERAGEKLGKARFEAYGRTTYPDATFTLRLSYGAVRGYPMNGTKAPSHTTFYGLYDRAASFNYEGPFALPSRYVEGRNKLDLSTAYNMVSTNDIIGGNSGSPVINRNGEIVGLIFDGNIESLVGDYVFDETSNRAVAVTTNAMTEALRKLYGAQKLVDELMQ
ncbi:MAG TPA: S46 family peptidase [Bryobacteraceae bacterium]|nr:S46 family peptidase [Bryobacteraceae bacterium]